jgi:hypothetical protein
MRAAITPAMFIHLHDVPDNVITAGLEECEPLGC